MSQNKLVSLAELTRVDRNDWQVNTNMSRTLPPYVEIESKIC